MRLHGKVPVVTFASVSKVLAGSCALVLLGCEMFFGDFVERQEPEPASECDPDECKGDTLHRCTIVDNQPKVETMPCGPRLCNRELLMCMMCEPGRFRCEGESLQKCNEADGSGWGVEQNCDMQTPKCDVETESCELCLIGDSKCEVVDGQHRRLQCQRTPDEKGRVWNATECGSGSCRTIDEATAYCEECDTPGDRRCSSSLGGGPSNTFVECSSDLRWIATPCPQGVCVGNGRCEVAGQSTDETSGEQTSL